MADRAALHVAAAAAAPCDEDDDKDDERTSNLDSKLLAWMDPS